ncbi:acyl-CoA reductase-like NAD-dependent aldehyde dehydrogenase [Litorivivens lipolytica]|uniref:aldehyde dehydrogenase (NAD(+)) n=1 Tax=Litorivivens lipolytica TaxID=1524264 RepID=A0A7W4W5Q4_9GAMM|nr:aldehyde dehydrogenase family protein [Litorivivens lipolytica]MBB3047919.1 acyl-CoA reductase-like NAD-dependent aldehyde dehydrogenase [Litorivivens lipolytica]
MHTISKHYINGEWLASDAVSSVHSIINPATEEVVGELHFGGKADVDRAVQAARAAFPAFASSSLQSRVDILKAIVAEYEKRFDDLAKAVSTEMGAPLERIAKGAQVPIGMGHFQTAIALADSIEWETRRGSAIVTREAAGVCALITPWNWPLNQIACKVAPALLSGCTMVLKPSEFAALSGQIFAEIMDAAGVPAGVFNVVWGSGPDIGPHMASHPEVDVVSLTGSTAAGASVSRSAADSIKRVSLELGGKSPNIILEDAPLEEAVTKGVLHLLNNSGQSCNAPSRMLVPESRLAEAEAIAVAAMGSVKVGDPLAPDTTTGPLANGRQFERVQALIERAESEGARKLVGGTGRPEGLDKGYFVKPTLFSVPDNKATIARQEVFGPVLTMIPYRDEAHAVEMANDTEYGLSAYVYGGSIESARKVGRQIRAGQVHLNGAGPDLQAPFGGFKQSGLGREWGPAGVEEFTELRAMLGAE